jgi:hypothetical protein
MDETAMTQGDGAMLTPQPLTTDRGEQAAQDAEHLSLALTAVAATRPELTYDAFKHSERLRFATQRLSELRDLAASEGGAFAPARAEVALSILEGQVALTAAFINRTMKDIRRRPGRRETHAAADEALSNMDAGTDAEAAA